MINKLLILTLLAVIATCQERDLSAIIEEERLFTRYLQRYGLDVRLELTIDEWKKNVLKKFKEIEKHNSAFRSGEELFERELNHLSHLSDEEFRNTLIKVQWTKDEVESKVDDIVKPEDTKDLPEYFNWVDKGIIQPVVDQVGCKSCYIFAAIAAIEAHACLYNNVCEKLSEQEAVECTAGGCEGGHDRHVYSYTQLKNGATYANYTYQAKAINSCDDTDKRPRVPGTVVKEWVKMPEDPETIRYHLYHKGPMTAVFDIHPNFHSYKRGIYSKTEGPVTGAHYALLVGWGTENGVDYWIYKNSWSETFGENGYFRASRGNNVANLEWYRPTYPVMEKI